MGLDITAYSNLKHIGRHKFDPSLNEGEPGPHCYYENHIQAFAYSGFPKSFRGIPILGTHPVGNGSFLEGGCYETTDDTERLPFQAGSYSGYNVWRHDLSELFNPQPPAGQNRFGMDVPGEPDPGKPFYELIWFADNEGCIGPEAAADLLADFREHEETYLKAHNSMDDEDEYYVALYRKWIRAFELGADHGLVCFH